MNIMENKNIHIAILGSLSTVRGDGSFISSSEEFAHSKILIEELGRFDNEFKQVFNRDEKNNHEEFEQYFLFLKYINSKYYHFLIRAKKNFTNFPTRDRFYDRREYFFYDIENKYDTIDFVKSLPVMKQYKENSNGKEIFPKIEKHNYNPDPQISQFILSTLLKNDTVKIKISDNAQELILNAVTIFPACYKKYLGFGFNVKDDSFTNANLHVFSTFDDGAIAIDTLKNSDNKQWNECVEFLLSNKNQYNDTEISKSEINRNTLYKLLDYHKLHYQVDKNIELKTKEEKGKIFKQTKEEYIDVFVKNENADKNYIIERVTAIYKYWFKQNMINFESFKWFNELCETKKFKIKRDKELENLEKNFLNDIIIVSSLSKENALYILFNHTKKLQDEKITDYLTHIELLNLHGEGERLRKCMTDNPIVRKKIIELLEKSDLITQLTWNKEYSNSQKDTFFSIEPLTLTSDYEGFSEICIGFRDYKSDYYKHGLVKNFVRGSISLEGNREIRFYESAIEMAKSYSFKIPVKTETVDGESLFDLYQLCDENKESIEDKKVLDEIAKNFISKHLIDIHKVSGFVKETEKIKLKFVETYKEDIINGICKETKEDHALITQLINIIINHHKGEEKDGGKSDKKSNLRKFFSRIKKVIQN